MSDAEATLWIPPKPANDTEPDAIAALKAVPLFSDLKPSELKKVRRLLHEREYQPGEVIFREGEAGHGMYLIKKGSVRIVVKTPVGEQELTVLTAPQFFGEMALLEDAPRSASSVAVERTVLLGFFEPDLESLIERDSELGSRILWRLARLMAARLRLTNDKLKEHRVGGAALAAAVGAEKRG